MSEPDAMDFGAIVDRLRALTAAGSIRITQHAQQEMVEENITLEEVLQAFGTGQIVEN